MTENERKAVLAEAMTWEGTPYHHRAMVKGAGADCALFPLAVYRSVLSLPQVEVPEYPMQWMMHRDRELYLEYIAALGGVETDEYAPGNFLVVRWGRTYSHGAILLDWPQVIHAVNLRGVIRSDALNDAVLAGRPWKVFSL